VNIFLRELRANLKALLIWIVSVGIFSAIMMYEFTAYYNNPDMLEFMDALPEAMLKAFSMAGADLTTVNGFISVAGIYFLIALGIYSALQGSSIIAKEERDKTAEFFMTMPISRKRVVSWKIISGIVLSLLLNLSLAVILYLTTIPYDRGDNFFSFMGLLMTSIFLVQLFFFSIGLAISSLLKNNKQSGKISIAILFGMYMLSIFVSLSEKIDFLHYLTPFKYFEAGSILADEKLKIVYMIIVLLVFIAGVTITYIKYPKRDLHV